MKYYVYIITNKPKGVLYIGITSNLAKRIYEHRSKMLDSFSKRYHLDKLIYVEEYDEVMDAIKCEKQLKNWHRAWKIEMID